MLEVFQLEILLFIAELWKRPDKLVAKGKLQLLSALLNDVLKNICRISVMLVMSQLSKSALKELL